MSWLDYAGVLRSHWNLYHTLAGHGPERMEITRHTRDDTVVREILAQRPRAVRPIIVKRDARRVRMALGRKAEEIHDLTLEPVRRGIFRRNGRVGGLDGIDRCSDMEKRSQARQEPHVMHEEPSRDAPLVAREQRHEPCVQIED